MISHCLNIAGLILNMLGVVLAFFFGFPQPDLSEGIAIGMVNTSEHDAKQRALKALYSKRAFAGLTLMFAGFGAQPMGTVHPVTSLPLQSLRGNNTNLTNCKHL
jgi:hypothetical protein